MPVLESRVTVPEAQQWHLKRNSEVINDPRSCQYSQLSDSLLGIAIRCNTSVALVSQCIQVPSRFMILSPEATANASGLASGLISTRNFGATLSSFHFSLSPCLPISVSLSLSLFPVSGIDSSPLQWGASQGGLVQKTRRFVRRSLGSRLRLATQNRAPIIGYRGAKLPTKRKHV